MITPSDGVVSAFLICKGIGLFPVYQISATGADFLCVYLPAVDDESTRLVNVQLHIFCG